MRSTDQRSWRVPAYAPATLFALSLASPAAAGVGLATAHDSAGTTIDVAVHADACTHGGWAKEFARQTLELRGVPQAAIKTQGGTGSDAHGRWVLLEWERVEDGERRKSYGAGMSAAGEAAARENALKNLASASWRFGGRRHADARVVGSGTLPPGGRCVHGPTDRRAHVGDDERVIKLVCPDGEKAVRLRLAAKGNALEIRQNAGARHRIALLKLHERPPAALDPEGPSSMARGDGEAVANEEGETFWGDLHSDWSDHVVRDELTPELVGPPVQVDELAKRTIEAVCEQRGEGSAIMRSLRPTVEALEPAAKALEWLFGTSGYSCEGKQCRRTTGGVRG